MKKIKAVILTICLILLGTIGTNITEVHADTGDTFTAKISNTPTGGSEQKIDCLFKITKEAENGNNGEVHIGDGINVAIDRSTEGSIDIPNEVTDTTTGKTYTVITIGGYAFFNCSKLTSTGLAGNNTVTTIGKEAFRLCSSLKNTGLESNSSVTIIGEWAFEYCGSLMSTGLENNHTVVTIGERGFGTCNQLISTGLESNHTLTTIGESAFARCENLTSTGLEKNSTVTTIGREAFSSCLKLQSTGLENNNTVNTIGGWAFSYCENLTNTGLSSNSTVTTIGEGAFSSCHKLQSTGLESNSTVDTIDGWVFSYCTNLTNTGLENNNTIILISDYAFAGCNDLEKVTLSQNSKVATIGEGAFWKCSKLSNFVIIGNILPTLGKGVFNNTANDFAIYYPVHIINGHASINQADASTGKQINNSFTKDAKVTITADSLTGKQFKDWSIESGNVVLADDESSSTTFTMTDEVIKLTANYSNITYNVMVDNGTGSGKHAVGDTVTIIANQAPEGQHFKEWQVVSGDIKLKEPTKETTTFPMPASDVRVKAVYEDTQYTVSVDHGTGSGHYVMNDTVTIIANQTPEGQHFKEWQVVSGDIKLKEPTKETTTFPMPASDVRVKAVYEDTQYTVSVDHGTGSGHYVKEETVTIQADKIKGKEFDKWEVIKGNITIQDNEETTFIMPAEDVEIRALYKDVPVTKPIEPTPPKDTTGKPVSPETGDNSQVGLLTTLAMLSAGCIAFITGKKRKSISNNKK